MDSPASRLAADLDTMISCTCTCLGSFSVVREELRCVARGLLSGERAAVVGAGL